MVGLLSLMEGSDHMVTPADHTDTPSDHSVVDCEHSTVAQNDNAVEGGEGVIEKPSVEMSTETEARKDDSESQNVTSDVPSNLDSTNEGQVNVQELKSILKRRGQYTMRKVKVDFDLIPKIIPFDETKDYTVEIQIVAKEPVKIKSWAAIFAAQKAEAEAEAAAAAEADAALKKAEEVRMREVLKRVNKAKQVKEEEENKNRVPEEQQLADEKTEESVADQQSAADQQLADEKTEESVADQQSAADQQLADEKTEESVADQQSAADQQSFENYENQQLEKGITSDPICEAQESQQSPEVLSNGAELHNSNSAEGKGISENIASVGENSNVEASVAQLDDVAEVNTSQDGKSSDVSESLIEDVKGYDISVSSSADVSENLGEEMKKNVDVDCLSEDLERADFSERLSGERKSVEGSDSLSEDVKSNDGSESLSVNATSTDVSQDLNADATSSDISGRLSSEDGMNAEVSGSPSRNEKNSNVSESSRIDLNSAGGEQSCTHPLGGNSTDSKVKASISMNENLTDGILSEVNLYDKAKLPEEILVTAVSLVAEVLAETPVKLNGILSSDEDSETDCTSMNTDLPDPEKGELQNDDRTESSNEDLPNEDKTESVVEEFSEVSSRNSNIGWLEQSADEPPHPTAEIVEDQAETLKTVLTDVHKTKETSKTVLTDEHKAKLNNEVVSRKLNESLRKASTEIIQSAVRVLVEVEKVTLAVVNNMEPIVP
uniref:Uncharacterized protein n=1 Tax=Lygus hesperus TaxID=30085 RepID=A0A146M2X8_LYGHE